ncbi:BnaC04g08590D [Brassica napus]|uniref:Uncharacterized protein n=3 Tax=Brassica TaxID=3705 RepID=A0A8X7UTZ5_BRACI|nr:hypothetical protein Bca52824_049255 [Brassica carinata]CAF1814124.1 unnamed protein product [Brassica napus]CDY33180.1 BnaC04g08590D [Brassica napus]VDD05963.1 unnamed protein product [Brassica oleracea]
MFANNFIAHSFVDQNTASKEHKLLLRCKRLYLWCWKIYLPGLYDQVKETTSEISKIITAQGKDSESQPSGFSFVNCNISGTEKIWYIKEGSTVSVIGVVQRNESVLMIVPTTEPLAAGWQWSKCTFPASLEGIVLRCEDSSNVDAIPV